TLIDNRVYGSGTQLEELIMSIVVMARAHDESEMKSQRQSRAWQYKKSIAAQGVAITSKAPLWVRAVKGQKIELIPERAAIVKLIFNMALDGMGAQSIAQELNKKGDAFSGKNKGWHKSTIEKILVHPATYGAYQPHRRLPNGRRAKDGE